MVRVGALMAVPELLRERGVDANRLLAEFGLESAYFDDAENKIAFATMGRLLARCAAATACPHFGLLAGERGSASVLGAVGFLLQSAPNVRAALDGLSAHYRVHNPSAAIAFVEHDDYVAMNYRILPGGIEGSEQILDGAMAISFNLMRKLCGTTWLPAQVHFAHPEPNEIAPYRRIFHSTLHFDEDETALLFVSDWLNRVPPSADPLLHQMMQQRVDELEASTDDGVAGQVRRLLPQFVRGEDVSLGAMAQRLRLTSRTLNRRLAAEATTYAQLLEETRHAMARQLLDTTRMAAFEISDSLGYANPSAFTRAFRRWTGVGPQQWRLTRDE
jgi:AraC-like DNA-binding protein